LLEDIPEGFEDFRAKPLAFEDHGSAVLVLTRYSGRGKASGAEIGQTFNTIYALRNGAVVKTHDYATRAEALEAVGLRE
jgi:hypothetical protein